VDAVPTPHYVAKDEASAYGGATRRWLKVKQKGWTISDDR
jgi:hypothetical protein